MLRPRNGESHASVILPTLGRNMLRPYKWFCVSSNGIGSNEHVVIY